MRTKILAVIRRSRMRSKIEETLKAYKRGDFSTPFCVGRLEQLLNITIEHESRQDRRRRVFEQVALAFVAGDANYGQSYFQGRQLPEITHVAELILSESDKFANKTQEKGE